MNQIADSGRIIITPRQLRNTQGGAENARIAEELRKLEDEGIDAGRIQESSESVSADIDSEIEAQGYSPEQTEGELDLSFAFWASETSEKCADLGLKNFSVK